MGTKVHSRAINNDLYYYQNKNVFFKKCWYGIADVGITYYFKLMVRILKTERFGHSAPLKAHLGKILYRMLHNDANRANLKCAKIFKNYLVQPLRNMPSLEVFNERDLSGTVEIYESIKKGCCKAMFQASAQKTRKIAKRYIGPQLDSIILKAAKKNGIKTDKSLSEKENVIKLLKENLKLKEVIVQIVMEVLFPKQYDFEESWEGVCASFSSYFASQYFHGKSWEELGKESAKGLNKKARDAFSVYEFLYQNMQKTVQNVCPALNLVNAHFKVQSNPLDQMIFDSEVTKEIGINSILNLNDGVYEIGLVFRDEEGEEAGHSILWHKEGSKVHIIDANIGILRAENEKIEKLLNKLIGLYSQDSSFEFIALQICEYKHVPNKKRFKKALLQPI